MLGEKSGDPNGDALRRLAIIEEVPVMLSRHPTLFLRMGEGEHDPGLVTPSCEADLLGRRQTSLTLTPHHRGYERFRSRLQLAHPCLIAGATHLPNLRVVPTGLPSAR